MESTLWSANQTLVAGLVEAGVLEASAYQDFLTSTPLPDRDQAHGITNEAMYQIQNHFDEKLLQWIDSQTKDDENLVISGMTDGQYVPETESEMDCDQGQSSDDEVGSIRSRSSLGYDKTAVNASKMERPFHYVEDTGILEFQFPPGSTQVPMDQDKAENNIPNVTSEMVPNGSNISQDASVVNSDVTSLSTQSPPATTVSHPPVTTNGSQSTTMVTQQPKSAVNETTQLSSSPQTQILKLQGFTTFSCNRR